MGERLHDRSSAGKSIPDSSLAFRFWGAGLFVFPLMLLYIVIS
jgi:hypothetical protein